MRKRRRLFWNILTSLPIWVGLLVVVLSVFLWQAQRRENAREVQTMMAVQLRHVYNTVLYTIERQQVAPYKLRLKDLLGGDHYYGISMRITKDAQVYFNKGLFKPSLFKRWGVQTEFQKAGAHWVIRLAPDAQLLRDYKTYLPDLALFIGCLVAILLMIVGFLAMLASHREKAVQAANRQLRLETKEKEKLQRVLQQNQKLQAVGTLAGGVAHDFNNILYAMMGYVSMAREDLENNPQVRDNLAKVLKAGKRGQKLIGSMLSFSRQQQTHDVSLVDLVSMLMQVFELLQPALPASIHMVKHIPYEQASIMGDEQALTQVMVNIINNAVDAMDGTGTLTVTLSEARFRPAFCIEIKDTGSGMTEETKQRLFDPFYTTKAVDKGTGLGLSMAHGIIRDHKGSIHVDTELGKGSIFSIYLPKANTQGDAHGKNSTG